MPPEVLSLLAEFAALDKERLEFDRKAKKNKVRQDVISDLLLAMKIESGRYGEYDLEITSKQTPRVTDWPTFYDYLRQTGNLDMLTKHLTASAINARINDGEYVPAVVIDLKPVLKIS